MSNEKLESGLTSHLTQELDAWKPITEKPLALGESYLVMLREDNIFDFSSSRPVMAEYGFYKNKPNWTIFDRVTCLNEIADDEIICWMELPIPPKQSFLQHLEKCRKRVEDWPIWKQETIKGARA